MKATPVALFAAALYLTVPQLSSAADPQRPSTRKAPVTDTYFGTEVADNYRWLENLEDPEVKSWLKGQADYTAATLDKIAGRDALLKDFIRLDAMRPAVISAVSRKNGRYFYKKTLPTENVGRLYYRQGLDGKERLLFDPTAGASGKSVSLSFYLASEDGHKVVLGVAERGSESATIRVLDVETRTLMPETIVPCWDGIGGWSKDGSGFIYNLVNSSDVHDPNRELNTKTYYHALGTDPKQDVVVLSAAKYPALGIKPEDFPIIEYSDDYQYLFGYASSVRSELTAFVAPAGELLSGAIPWRPLLQPSDEVTSFVAHGDRLFLLSHKDAPRYRILETSLSAPDLAHATEVRPQGEDIIVSINRTRDYLLATTSDGINNRLFRFGYADGKWEEIPLPRKGTVFAVGYDAETNDGQVLITSWNKPSQRFQLDPVKKSLTLSPLNVPVRFPGTDDIVVDEVEALASDGTRIPLSILYNKKVARDGSASCFLSGYGAYGSSSSPGFGILNLALLNRGVVVAIAHVRGGGEKGFAWYRAGYKTTKPNTWNDFIACAEHLVQHKYTSAAHLFGMGTSAGGILIGRAITTRPDLFAAAICNVPCANALRMENSPNGPVNTPEFGTVKDSVECRALMEMDAFQHVREGAKYPAVLCVGGFNDPRVIVWQPAKFAATLQNSTASGKPVLLQVNYDNGHFTEDKKVTFRNFANMYSFGLWQTGHADFQMKKLSAAAEP